MRVGAAIPMTFRERMKRFTLTAGTWYACELIGDEFVKDKCSYSPIRVDELIPSQSGDRIFELRFFHANYPEGVQEKIYRLKTIHRGESLILARSIDHNPARFLQIYEITADWLRSHFEVSDAIQVDPQVILNRTQQAPNKTDMATANKPPC